MIGSFSFFLLIFTGIGVFSVFRSKKTTSDYLVAERSMKPWLVGLSAVATNNSGYMFTGMIGFTYSFGWSSVWLMLGWLFGDLMGSLLIHKNLRLETERVDIHTFSGILSHWGGTHFRYLRIICGIISILFLGAYAAAQLNAGSKALHILFGWDLSIGAIIGSVIVLLYCFSGGIRASIWTDAAQSIVMVFSMALLFFVALSSVGGLDQAITKLNQVQLGYMSWFPSQLPIQGFWGPFLFVLGWVFAGFGVVGQPHIMVRFMSIDNPQKMHHARIYYYLWFFIFYALTIGVGLLSRLLLPGGEVFDAELALPMLSTQLLHPTLVGLMLAGLFAATMSTADSLILSCSASLTQDFIPSQTQHKNLYLITKLGTILITGLALWIALKGNKSVFQLVLYSWAVLAAAFGPLLLVYSFKQKPQQWLAILMVLSGTITIFIWKHFGLSDLIYEIAPGILVGLAIFLIGKAVGGTKKE